MARLIKKDRGNYTNTSNQLIRDTSLSWKARGIFVYLWSQANEWKFYVNEIAKHATDGERSLKAGLQELESHGYLKRVNRHSKEGNFDGLEWILDDSASLNNQVQDRKSDKMFNNIEKNEQNASDAKRIRRETRPTQNSPLRNNNNKKYQSKELTSLNSSANAEQSKTRIQKNILDKAEPPVYKKVIDYLNSKIGSKYKPNSAVNKRLIDARAKEGYSLDDFKRVIDNKYATWAFDSKMRKYLRPQTLFGSKFESYLNEKPANAPTHTDFNVLKDDTIENIPDDELPF